MPNNVVAKLNKSRKELLDLGLRNPLLNYRARVNKIVIVGNHSASIYRLLVKEGKTFTFLPAEQNQPEEDSQQGELDVVQNNEKKGSSVGAIEIDQTSQDIIPDGQAEVRFQTRLDSERLRAKLLNIQNNAKTYVEEQGVNILYLALGFLRWYESDSSDQVRHAPLVLIPVELSRENARSRFKLKYSEEEITANLSLVEKLKSEFAIQIPEITDTDDFDVAAYHEEIDKQIAIQHRWKVEADEIVLGFFSFGKFLMYKDLAEDRWQSGKRPSEHVILHALLEDGFKDPPLSLPDDTFVDERIAPSDIHQVMDADSSQILAILDVNAGHNLVIQGPPGTGKSQTITNIIAEAIGNGKTVLFVAEKMAALEVVKRRLDNIGLGEAVLELHSHKTNKRSVLKELGRITELGKPSLQTASDDIGTLVDLQNRLNAYCNAVNTPILESGITPYRALGAYIALGNDAPSLPRMDFSIMQPWTQAKYRDTYFAIEELQTRLKQIGIPRKNPFWGTKRTVLLPSDEPELKNLIARTEKSTRLLLEHASTLATTLGVSVPTTVVGVEELCQIAARTTSAPDLRGVHIRSDEWILCGDELKQLLTAGYTLNSLHDQYATHLKPEAWERNLHLVQQHYLTYGNKWWRFLSGEYRNAKRQLASLCKQPLPKDGESCLELINAVQQSQKHQATYKQHQSLGKTLFGTRWRELNSNWAVLSAVFEWLTSVHRDIAEKRLPDNLIDYLSQSPDLNALRDQYENAIQQLKEQREISTVTENKLNFQGEVKPLSGRSFADQLATIQAWLACFKELQGLANYNLLANRIRALGLSTVLNIVEDWNDASKDLLRAFNATWYGGLLETAFREREPLQQFERSSHEYVINKFRELDKLLFVHNRARLALKHWDNLPRFEQGGELRIIKREINKKRGHLPIRQLLEQAGRAIQAIKPVFMMGPLSIANFLKPGHLEFDLVIFDEASQVKPVDGFGAILRGKQAVVVGDSKQLPPTNFFDSLVGETLDDDENESVTVDLESILGLFAAQNAPERMLRWHYRSRHESLIAVSNHEFYDNKLVVFPSPIISDTNLGLRFNHLPNTQYDRGKTRTNLGEAKAIAEAVMRYAKTQPNLTMGVAAFSTAQRDAILDQLELIRRRDISCEEYFNAHAHEPFFVKNLENVQGDERDVILISIGYGKTAEGYMSMSFGPLNQDGGDRRLNVLITRARQICDVFANFTAADIDLQRSNARGVLALKNFLSYAQDRVLETPLTTGHETDSPFEEAVIENLHKLGYKTEAQVGCAGFRVDIGIVDPEKPGRYLLGIECDGASYHSARSARDRDRLRQEILENLGWRIHRVWSTEWFRNPNKELERAAEAIEHAKLHWKSLNSKRSVSGSSSAPIQATTVIPRQNENDSIKQTWSPKPYHLCQLVVKLCGRELHQLKPVDLSTYIQEIVITESPVHIEDVIKRIGDAAGVKRIGNRIRKLMMLGIAFAIKTKAVVRDCDFLWAPNAQKIIHVRNRSNLDVASRALERVAPQEILAAIKHVVGSAFSIKKDEALSLSLELLGFQRVTNSARTVIDKILDDALQHRELIEQDGLLRTVSAD